MSGRDKGLAQYCRPQNGYRLGASGYRYAGVCPSESEGAFLAAHADGYGLYKRRVAVARIVKRLQKSKRRADQIEFSFVEKTAQLVSGDVSVAQRAAIGVEIKQLAEKKADLALTIQQLEYDREVAQRDYDEYRARMADRNGG